MKKYEIVLNSISRRITNGEYQLSQFPTVVELAEETHVSKVTAQKVVKVLQERGLIQLGAKGRFEVTRDAQGERPLQVVFLDHGTPEARHQSNGGFEALRVAAQSRNCIARHVFYEHWDDPILIESLNSFDGVFLVPLPTPSIPDAVLQKLRAKQRLVILETDLTHMGLFSLLFYPSVFVQRLLDHLVTLGHQRIDCLNVQPIAPYIEARIAQWQLWMAAHQFTGQLINAPVLMGRSPYPHAYQVMSELLDHGEFTATALLCITNAAAVSAMRALHEHGIRIGADVAVCAVSAEEGPYLHPSLTSLRMPDFQPSFALCLDWMRQGDIPWPGPLLLQTQEAEIFIGESTVPQSAYVAV